MRGDISRWGKGKGKHAIIGLSKGREKERGKGRKRRKRSKRNWKSKKRFVNCEKIVYRNKKRKRIVWKVLIFLL